MHENSADSDELLTQVQVEQRMYYGGIKRADNMMARAEEAGNAHRNPYAKQVFRDFVQPLADVIRKDCAPGRGPGRAVAHVALLRPLDPDAVALLAVRTALNACLDYRTSSKCDERGVAFKIGAAVNSELVLSQIEEDNPELYHTLANDLQRKMSTDQRHKMTVYRTQARKAGIDWVEWPLGAKEQVGSYLLGNLITAGMLDMAATVERRGYKSVPRAVMLSEAVMQAIDKIKGYCAVTSPVYGPCVEPPLPWVTPTGGGFHTPELRRTLPMVVRCHPAARQRVREREMPTVLAAVNMLQQTAWQVNERILDTVYSLSRAGIRTAEIVSAEHPPKPPRPAAIPEGVKSEDMDDATRTLFVQWKREVTEWHTQRKLAGVRYGRFHAATRAAETFRKYPNLYFVHFADSRGRLYPLTYGVNPQGSDLQKALLRFADGFPLNTASAIRWWHILGANKFGFDKATLSERFMWAHDRRDLILSFAADPVSNRGWLDAGDPLQFLAWCFEYADWAADPDGFVSHLPVGMDGSCNGLQNLSALLRDEVGGEATNLTCNETMQDIYGRVANKAASRLAAHSYGDPDKDRIRDLWIAHGVARAAVKRSVMTTPYGVTRRSATKYVVEDYLKGTPNPFTRSEYRLAATVLMDHVWPAIGDVVVKGRQCMDWLHSGARAAIKAGHERIEWETPSGFPASQSYYDIETYRIRTRLIGVETIKIAVAAETDAPDILRHASGLAPNFVHSMDAAHLHRVAARCLRAGIPAVAMVHDDYGTHAANAQTLFEFIREEFVGMYEERDPVREFADKYPEVGDPPTRGSLDIREVLRSDFFFS